MVGDGGRWWEIVREIVREITHLHPISVEARAHPAAASKEVGEAKNVRVVTSGFGVESGRGHATHLIEGGQGVEGVRAEKDMEGGEMWEMWGDEGRYGEMWGDVGRCGEMWGDVGRSRT